jgi:pSer/pThr/pTyr-binding forkhead associated (FHA) protein
VKTIDGVATIRLDLPSEHIIGREHELAEYLKNKLFVSRKHALITVTSEGVFIQNLSNANGTYVNNERIDNNSAIKLCKDDEIGLGGLVNQNGRQDMAAYLVVGID